MLVLSLMLFKVTNKEAVMAMPAMCDWISYQTETRCSIFKPASILILVSAKAAAHQKILALARFFKEMTPTSRSKWRESPGIEARGVSRIWP